MIEGSLDKREGLARLLTHLFSNENLYIDHYLRKLIASNPRGYIHLRELLPLSGVKCYFKETQIKEEKIQIVFLRNIIKDFCPELYCHANRVRRLCPFDHSVFKRVKPLGLEQFSERMSMSDLREFFGP